MELKKQFKNCGFIQYESININDIDMSYLQQEFKSLELDPFRPSETLRYRCYGNALILPWEDELKVKWIPSKNINNKNLSGYDQGGNNPEHSSMRYFASIHEKVKRTSFLNDLVIEDYKLTFGFEDLSLPVYVGIHFVKLYSTDMSLPSISSPDCFHQDGELFTFAHLVYRSENADGGVNYFACTTQRNLRLEDVDQSKIISSFTLKNFGDSFAVHDPDVCHYVSPITPKKNEIKSAERWMILIDFSKTKQDI